MSPSMEKRDVSDPDVRDIADDEVGTQTLQVDPKLEAQLLRKLDIWIAPFMTVIFLTAYLDRANIGNAASAGMTEDIGMSDSELGNAVTLFYVTYVAAEVPCSLVMKKLRPSKLQMCTALLNAANMLQAG